MSEASEAAPAGVDTGEVGISRMYDYFLGGSHHFEADRRFAERILAVVPEAPEVAVLNRAFLLRAVRHCFDLGIRQFLDLGSGIPTVGGVGNTHELAQSLDPRCRVVYADIEPMAVHHGREILADNPLADMVECDIRDFDRLLGTPAVRGLIDFDQPLGLLMLGVLHYVPDADRPGDLVRRYRDVLAPGSCLVVSHGTEGVRPEPVQSMIDLTQSTRTPGYMRTPAEVEAFFEGFELVEPGVVPTPDWRPAPGDDRGGPVARSMACAGVGVKPVDPR
jgi:SAM-dependent methyltransferase